MLTEITWPEVSIVASRFQLSLMVSSDKNMWIGKGKHCIIVDKSLWLYNHVVWKTCKSGDLHHLQKSWDYKIWSCIPWDIEPRSDFLWRPAAVYTTDRPADLLWISVRQFYCLTTFFNSKIVWWVIGDFVQGIWMKQSSFPILPVMVNKNILYMKTWNI